MRLFRWNRGQGALGCGLALADGRRFDVGHLTGDFDEKFFESGGLGELRRWVDEGCPKGVEMVGKIDLLAPVARPSKIVCVGLNYAAHAVESGAELPSEPMLFQKASTTWASPNGELVLPPKSTASDYEVELGVILEKRIVHVEPKEVLSVIAGYTVFCDFSERSYQKERGGQWTKGKSYDGFGPAGPMLVTTEEIPDPQKLRLWSKVNGEIRQDSNTSDMVFHVTKLVSYISQFMTLLPGDVIATGTPSGVGMGFDPPKFLKNGDVVELGIEGIGEIRQEVRDA